MKNFILLMLLVAVSSYSYQNALYRKNQKNACIYKLRKKFQTNPEVIMQEITADSKANIICEEIYDEK